MIINIYNNRAAFGIKTLLFVTFENIQYNYISVVFLYQISISSGSFVKREILPFLGKKSTCPHNYAHAHFACTHIKGKGWYA